MDISIFPDSHELRHCWFAELNSMFYLLATVTCQFQVFKLNISIIFRVFKDSAGLPWLTSHSTSTCKYLSSRPTCSIASPTYWAHFYYFDIYSFDVNNHFSSIAGCQLSVNFIVPYSVDRQM